MGLQLETTDKLITHNTVDYITVGSADKIVLTPGANPNRLGSIDSLTVTPYQSATAVDYTIPQSVVQGLADVAAIREDLLQKLAGLELAIVEAQQYRDWVANDVRNQVFTEMSANYLSNAAMPEAIQAQILATDLSNMAIATGAGGTTASFQEIADRYVEVGEAVSGFTSQLEANTTNASSALQQTEVLTAKVDDVEATVTSMEYVAIGGFTEWDGISIPITGQWRGSSGAYEQYIGDEWITITDEQHSRYSIQLAIAGAKSLSTVGDTIVGWEYANGGAGDNKFQIRADAFKIVDSTVQAGDIPASPFSTVRNADGTHTVTFNGKVTFNGGTRTGTIEDAIQSTYENLVVGDKNINITDNLIPTDSVYADLNNGGYQFVGNPNKSMLTGIDDFVELQIDLDSDDEVYSPYVEELNVSYYYRFGVKGITNINNAFKIVTVDENNVIAYNNIAVNMLDNNTLVNTKWYIVEGLINPYGGRSNANGAVRLADGTKIGTINDLPLSITNDVGSKLLLGWTGTCSISRMKIAKITADTYTGNVASVDYVNNAAIDNNDKFAQQLGYSSYNNLVTNAALGNTIINGGYINTNLIKAGTIIADQINTKGLIAENISASTLTGKTLSGGSINGAFINGGVILGSFIQSSVSFDDVTPYTSCPNYPGGLPYIIVLPSKIYENASFILNSTDSYYNGIATYNYCSDSAIRFKNSSITITNGEVSYCSYSIKTTSTSTTSPSNYIDASSYITVTVGDTVKTESVASIKSGGVYSSVVNRSSGLYYYDKDVYVGNMKLNFRYTQTSSVNASLFGPGQYEGITVNVSTVPNATISASTASANTLAFTARVNSSVAISQTRSVKFASITQG